MGAYGEGASGVFGITELGAGGDYDKGRTFYLHEIGDLERIVRTRQMGRRPFELEPALMKLADAWAAITDSSASPDGTAPEADDDTPAAVDYDATGLQAKVAQARDAGTGDVEIPPIPEGMEEHAAASQAERRRQFLEAYTDIDLPEADQATLRQALESADGISTRAAAALVPWSHTRVHQQMVRWREEGTVELRGKGAARRWHAIAPARVTYLQLVQPPSGGAS
jgi:hypothetical protein